MDLEARSFDAVVCKESECESGLRMLKYFIVAMSDDSSCLSRDCLDLLLSSASFVPDGQN